MFLIWVLLAVFTFVIVKLSMLAKMKAHEVREPPQGEIARLAFGARLFVCTPTCEALRKHHQSRVN